MNIFLARHGDTFEPGQKVVWAGTRNDLELATRGREQARAVGELFLKLGVKFDAVFCSELRRTRVFSEIICQTIGLGGPPRVEHRLNEIDYGDWTGLSVEEVKSKFGAREIEDWETKSIWPGSGIFPESEASIILEVEGFIAELERYQADANILLVSSGGRLRFFLRHCQEEFSRRLASRGFKMRTGALGLMRQSIPPQICFWDMRPEECDLSSVKSVLKQV